MDDRSPHSDRTLRAARSTRWLKRLGVYRKIFETCENANCEKRRGAVALWQHDSDGIRLQGRWYCGPECFEQAALSEFRRLSSEPETGVKKPHRMPIGLLLLSRGMINDDQLKRALLLQREQGIGKIGKFLQEIGAVTENDIAVGLAAQWGCPVYPLDTAQDRLRSAPMLPRTLLEAGRMLPVHHLRVQQTLYLAFVEGIDRNALYAVEQMLRLRTIPCIVSESSYLDAIDTLSRVEDLQTAVFDSHFEPREMASTTRSYAWRVGADDVWMVRSGRFIWVRLQNQDGNKDILFRAFAVV